MKPNAKLKYKSSLAAWVYTKKSPGSATLLLVKLTFADEIWLSPLSGKRLSAHSLDIYFVL